MLKLLLWPFVVAILALVLIVVFARRGNAVSRFARHTGPIESSFTLWWLLMFASLAAFLFLLTREPSIEKVLGIIVAAIVVVISGMGLASRAALGLFAAAAPMAAQIGNEMSDQQKRSMLRRTGRWFRQFQKQ